MRRPRIVTLAAVVVAAVGACTDIEPWDFQLALSAARVDIAAGSAGAVDVQVHCSGVPDGPVLLSVEGLPAGSAVGFAPSSVTCESASTLTIDVAASVPDGDHTLTVRGASGTLERATTLTLSVGTPSFSLAADPASLTIEQTLSSSATITIARADAAVGPVALALEGGPAGVVGVFADNPVAGVETDLVVSVADTVPPGAYPLSVRGTAGGVRYTTALTATVVARGFVLAATPETVYVTRGGADTVLVDIQRTASFTEAVELDVLGVPAGVAATFDPNPSLGGASTLTIAVDASTATGSYALTVRASSGDDYVDTADVTVVVTEPDAAGFSLSLDTSSLTLAQGDTGDVLVTISRTGGFADDVELSAALKPTADHVVVTFDPVDASTQSVMTVVIGNNVPPRTYLVEVRGMSGTIRDTVPLALVVVPSD